MKDIKACLKPATSLLVAALLTGCAHVKPQPHAAARGGADFNARTLADPGLRRFVEQNLGRPLQTWPLESWDFPKLTLAAFYFHPSPATAPVQWRAPQDVKAEQPAGSANRSAGAGAWQVRTTLRTNLLAYCAAQRRQELLRDLESVQMELAQVVEERRAAGAKPPVQLSLLQIQLADTRLELIRALQKKMILRERVADSLGLPVKALLEVQIVYDLARARYDLSSRALRRQALHRSDISLAVADYKAAEAALRREIAKRHANTRFNPGCQWDADQNRWTVNLTLDLPVNANRGPIAKAEARRTKAAACLLNLQTDIIDELDRQAAVYRARLGDATDIDGLVGAIRRQRDAVAARFEAGGASQSELIMAQLQCLPAQLAQLDAQEKTQQALGALEDAAQLPDDITDPAPSVGAGRSVRGAPLRSNPALIPVDPL